MEPIARGALPVNAHAAMASDRRPDASSNDENRDESDSTELNTKHVPAASGAAATETVERATNEDGEPGVRRAPSTSRSDTGDTRRSKNRRIIEDEFDEELEDDEDEDEEEIRRRERERRARAKRQAARRKGTKRKRNIPTTEEQLNVPKRQTIGMLGSVSILMIIIWFSARLACNAHPDHIRDPRYVSVDQLSRDPKNAGLEFALRLASKDVLLAGEIATGAVADKVRELIQSCETNMDACAREREALKNKVTGTARLLEMNPKRALVEVTTYTSNENPQTKQLELVPVGKVWKVAQSRDVETKPEVSEAMGAPADSGVAASVPE